MIDIFAPSEGGLDLGAADTDVTKAANILNVQLGSLEYLPDFGVDIEYFLTEDVVFENVSFKSYLIQVLSDNGINVSKVVDIVENLYEGYIMSVNSNDNGSQLVAR